MSLIKRIIPKSIKRKLKESICLMDEKTIDTIVDEVSDRKASAMLAASIADGKFRDKVIVVTGGSGHIGSAISRRFANEGAVVIACGRILERIKDLYKEETFKNGIIVPYAMDVLNGSMIKNAFCDIVDKYHHIDVLVNCAGGSARDEWSSLVNQSDEIIENIISTNLTGSLFCSKYAAKYMCERHSGRIVNVSSTVGVGGKAGFTDYAAAKAGVIGFTRSLALELGENGITVNCVTPGIVQRNGITASNIVGIAQKNAMNSFGIANDIAYATEFLVSPEANFITGQNIVVDGGRSLGLKGD